MMDNDEAYEFFVEKVNEWAFTLARAAQDGAEEVRWEKPSLRKVKRVWEESKMAVLHETWLEEIAIMFINTIARLHAQTILAGHTQVNPAYYLKELYEIELEEHEWERIYDYTWDEGNDGISDSACPKLDAIAIQILTTDDLMKKLWYCDTILNVVHQRGDLSKFFIQGGKVSLDLLFTGQPIS